MNKIREMFKDKKVKRLVLLGLGFVILMFCLKMFLVIRSVPDLNIDDLKHGVGQNSKILDVSGRVIGQSVGNEFRSSISIDDLPSYVPQAFIAIEDKRFYSHIGVDFRGLVGAMLDNIKAGKLVRGASTITQQLIKNTHLSNERTLDRKIKEAYLSIKLETLMTKDEILEAYLNNTFFGQGAYGIEAASNIYFSKSASDLKLEEAAILAAIIQSPDRYAPYKRINKSDIDYNNDTVIGEVVVGGNRFTCVYSGEFEDRRDLVLKEMLKQGRINKDLYVKAVNTPSVSLIKPSEKTMSDQMYYISDFVKTEAIQKLMDIKGYSYEKASYLLDVSGYTIKTSIDMNVQQKINKIYDNRNNINDLLKYLNYSIDPNTKNMLNNKGDILYYSKDNILDKNNWFYFNKDEFSVIDGDLKISSNKIEAFNNTIYYKDYYSFSESGDLYIYNIDKTTFPEGSLIIEDKNNVLIKKDYLDSNPDFFLNNGEVMKINNLYYNIDKYGKKQPDAFSILINPKEGLILGMYGGTNPYNGYASNRIYNHKFSPMKTIRPFSIYYPKNINSDQLIKKSSLKNGNQFSSDTYKELSQNSEELIIESLKLFDLIDEKNRRNSFVSKEDSPLNNDESMDALVYGRFTKGLSLFDLSKPYSLLLSDNNKELSSILEIIDSDGNVVYTHLNRDEKPFNNYAKFFTKMLLANNNYNLKIHQMIANNKESLTIYGSEDILILSMITNDQSKIRFTQDLSSNIINRLLEETFKDDLKKNVFSSPEGVYEYNICLDSGKIANETCINYGNVDFVYFDKVMDDVCEIDHSPIEEDDADKDAQSNEDTDIPDATEVEGPDDLGNEEIGDDIYDKDDNEFDDKIENEGKEQDKPGNQIEYEDGYDDNNIQGEDPDDEIDNNVDDTIEDDFEILENDDSDLEIDG